ncbi:MAG: hypothetical protein LBJ58_08200 [Tannerellaceae bacterium]|jgi:hypothetical protein|nr:hypothetical protein [Tannerellaceae bacterium]
MNILSFKNSRMYFYLRSFARKCYSIGLKIIKKVKPGFTARGTGGTISARYCYSVFMRHIVQLFNNGMKTIPLRIAEFGPGDSLGIGLCAILAGSDEYYALDVVDHANNARNLKILNELALLFKEKAAIPDSNEFPEVKPLLDDYSFPAHIFSDDDLATNLSEDRLESIRQILSPAFRKNESGKIKIEYIVPWENYGNSYPVVDFVFSQAVLEHIDNLKNFYAVMSKILTDEGFVSHEIDFRSHSETYEWNGHWGITMTQWEKNRGTRPYLLNREPLSTHLQLFKESGFQIIAKIPSPGAAEGKPSIGRKKLVDRFLNLSDEDFETASCYIIARKFTDAE